MSELLEKTMNLLTVYKIGLLNGEIPENKVLEMSAKAFIKLFQQERVKAQEEAIKKLDKITYLEFAIAILKNFPTGMFDSTPYKEEQLKSLENELKQSLGEKG